MKPVFPLEPGTFQTPWVNAAAASFSPSEQFLNCLSLGFPPPPPPHLLLPPSDWAVTSCELSLSSFHCTFHPADPSSDSKNLSQVTASQIRCPLDLSPLPPSALHAHLCARSPRLVSLLPLPATSLPVFLVLGVASCVLHVIYHFCPCLLNQSGLSMLAQKSPSGPPLPSLSCCPGPGAPPRVLQHCSSLLTGVPTLNHFPGALSY